MLQLIDLARVGFCISDVDGVILSADKTYSSIMNYDHIKSGELGVSDVTLPQDCRSLTEVMGKVMFTGMPLVYRRPAICGDGEIIWVENRLSLLQSSEEKRFLVASREIEKPPPPKGGAEQLFPAKTCAAYVADLAGELGAMASSSNLTLTAELLSLVSEMVQAEAKSLGARIELMTH